MDDIVLEEAYGKVFLTDIELADRWGISPKTLRNKRVTGASPIAFVRIGRLIRYRLAEVLAYEESQSRGSTSDKGKANLAGPRKRSI